MAGGRAPRKKPVGTGDEGDINISPTNSLLTSAIGKAGLLSLARAANDVYLDPFCRR